MKTFGSWSSNSSETHGDCLRFIKDRMLGRVSESGLIPVNPDQLSLRRSKRGAAAAAVFGCLQGKCMLQTVITSCFSLWVFPFSAFLHSPHQPVYTATKHGVIGFTRAMAVRRTHISESAARSLSGWEGHSAARSRVAVGRGHSGRLRRSHQRPVSGLRRHAAAAVGGRWGQHGQVRQVQGRLQTEHDQVRSFTVSPLSKAEVSGSCVSQQERSLKLM